MKKFGELLILEVSAILWHRRKPKTNGTYFLSVQNLFVKKRRFNAESVKILIAAYAFFFNCSAENRISKQQFFDFQIFALR